jgi:manganese-dependent inorganic pyrophosphatase
MALKQVFVFGHRNPDTDAICAALAYADFLRLTTIPEAVAACCGPPNLRTEFVLETAKLDLPRIVMDVRPEVGDICQRDVVTACEDEVFYEVYERLKRHSLRSVPVKGSDGSVCGLISLVELLEVVFQDGDDALGSRRVSSCLDKICRVLGGEFQHAGDIHQPADFLVMVGAMSAHGFKERLHRFDPSQLLVVTGDRPTIQLPALERGVRGMVVTGGYDLSPDLLELAQEKNVTVIKSPFDTATTTIKIKTARAIKNAIQRKFVTLSDKQPLAEARRLFDRASQPMFPVVDDEGHLIGVVSKTDLINPPKPRLVLVDHNEITQAVDGAEESEILEVLDHHRLGGSLKTTQPIRLSMEPVGSTCTLVARRYREAGLKPTKGIAICLASGIISDTLFLRSPTTTDVDRDMLYWLEPLCQINLEEYAQEFFAIGSALRTCTSSQVVREDCKEFIENKHRFTISQIEEIGFDLFWSRKDELQSALVELSQSKGLEFSALLVTDIVSNSSLLLMSQEPAGWEAINYPRVDRKLYKLDNVVSRKKQLLPLISRLLESVEAGRK